MRQGVNDGVEAEGCASVERREVCHHARALRPGARGATKPVANFSARGGRRAAQRRTGRPQHVRALRCGAHGRVMSSRAHETCHTVARARMRALEVESPPRERLHTAVSHPP